MNKICNELGNEYLDNLTTNRIQTYLNKEQKSRKKELLVLYFESAIKKALELDITKNNFIKGIIKDKKIKNKRFAFNYFEQEQILQELENYPNIKMAIYFYLLTGARKNELIKNSKDIDLQNNFITIRGTKTEKSKLRVIECASEFLQQLQNYMNNNKFPTTAYIAKIFNKLCKSININNGTLHRLRHTFATNCYVLGIKDKQIQEWLGHESIETTMNIYTDLDKTLTKEKIITLYKNMYYLPND
jgi:integrase